MYHSINLSQSLLTFLNKMLDAFRQSREKIKLLLSWKMRKRSRLSKATLNSFLFFYFLKKKKVVRCTFLKKFFFLFN